MKEQADEAKSTTKKGEIKCYKCKEYGHKCSACPNWKIRKQLPTSEPYLLFLPIICFACDKLGHKASMCPQKKKNKKRFQAPGSTSKAIQGSSTTFHNYPASLLSGNYHNLHRYHTCKYPKPFCRRDALATNIRVYSSLRMPSA